MVYAFFGEAKSESLDRFARLLGGELERAGFTFGDGDAREADLVLSLVEPDEAKPFRRGRAARTCSRCSSGPRSGADRESLERTTRCCCARSRTS